MWHASLTKFFGAFYSMEKSIWKLMYGHTNRCKCDVKLVTQFRCSIKKKYPVNRWNSIQLKMCAFFSVQTPLRNWFVSVFQKPIGYGTICELIWLTRLHAAPLNTAHICRMQLWARHLFYFLPIVGRISKRPFKWLVARMSLNVRTSNFINNVHLHLVLCVQSHTFSNRLIWIGLAMNAVSISIYDYF